MAKYWSPENLGFYDTDIISESNLPEDCIYITDEAHAELMTKQCEGYVIVNGADDYPTAMQQTCQPCTCITHEEEIATTEQLGHVKIGEGITVTEDGTISADIPAEMVGATASAAGQAGIVPAPAAGEQNKFLRGDGDWADADKFYRRQITTSDWELETTSGRYKCIIDKSSSSDSFVAAFDSDGNQVLVDAYDNNNQLVLAAIAAFDGYAIVSSSGEGQSVDATVVVAEKLAVERSVTLTGDVTGSAAFDGSADITINTAIPGAEYVPTGAVFHFAMASAPNGYLVCNGAAVSRTTYAKLYALIGDYWGAGDGSTTFNLPDMIGRFIEGGAPGMYKEAGLPNITGMLESKSSANHQFLADTLDVVDGAFSVSGKGGKGGINGDENIKWGYDGLYFDASLSSPIYGNSDTVQPPALTLLPCIKY